MSKRCLSAMCMVMLLGAGPLLLARPNEGAAPAKPEVTWPDTPAGRWLKAYVEAYNTPGREALRQFVKDHFSEAYLREHPLEQVVSDHFQTRGMLSRLDVHSVRADGEFIAALVVEAKPYGWAEFRVELSPEPPHQSVDLRIGPTDPPDSKAKTARDYNDWKTLQNLAEQVRQDAGAPAVAVAVVRAGRIVESAASGVRRVDQPDRVQIGDRFHLGSVAKSFTATMIGKLVEEGVLRWDTTIEDALPDVRMKPAYRSVTLDQLLQHRGGVPAMCSTGEFERGCAGLPPRKPAEARAALVRQVLTEEPFKMGEYAYSNAGYVVAGYMAERAAKRSWEELMRTLVFEPLGLRSAGTGWPATVDRPHEPLGHYGTPPNYTIQQIGEDPAGDDDYYGPAGSVHCSVEDLARFVAFHMQGLRGQNGVLKAETIRHLHAPAAGGHYMGGWGIHKDERGNRRDGHQGTSGTFFAEMTLYPDNDLGIVAVANCGPTVAPFFEKMKTAILRRMAEAGGAPGTPHAVQWPDTVAARRAQALVQAMNADGEDSMREFIADNYSPASLAKQSAEERAKMPLAIRARTGKLTVHSAKTVDERTVAFVCKAEAVDVWLEFTLKLEQEPPYYCAGITIMPTAAP
jgi:D-alanyl-D-alanine carboxypeptidase